MSEIHTIEEKEEREDNIVQLKLLPGGRDSGPNWLKGLPHGTIFLTKKRNKVTMVLDQYHIVFQFDRATLLLQNSNGEEMFYVDSAEFSREMELFEILKEAESGPTDDE